MQPIQLYPLSDEALTELDDLYRTTRDVRIRTRHWVQGLYYFVGSYPAELVCLYLGRFGSCLLGLDHAVQYLFQGHRMTAYAV